MTTFDIVVPLFFLGVAAVGVLLVRYSAKRLEASNRHDHPAE